MEVELKKRKIENMLGSVISASRYFIWRTLWSRMHWEILKIKTQLKFLSEEMDFASECFLFICFIHNLWGWNTISDSGGAKLQIFGHWKACCREVQLIFTLFFCMFSLASASLGIISIRDWMLGKMELIWVRIVSVLSAEVEEREQPSDATLCAFQHDLVLGIK